MESKDPVQPTVRAEIAGTAQSEATNPTVAPLASHRTGHHIWTAAISLGAAAVASGLVFSTLPALAAPTGDHGQMTSTADILSIARTAEQLAVTFYSEGIKHHQQLGIQGSDLAYLQAAATEEQIHMEFLAENGGESLTDIFSFPEGHDTFKNLSLFVQTLEQLETAFVAAYVVAAGEFAQQSRPDLAQIAAQLCGVESEHRALGRDLAGLTPATNVAFEIALFNHVSDAFSALKAGGFLSPSDVNRFKYEPVSNRFPGVTGIQP
jgi:Ferritin-like domain